ncbi:MAG: MFS transporter [Acidothermaceae bacterium]
MSDIRPPREPGPPGPPGRPGPTSSSWDDDVRDTAGPGGVQTVARGLAKSVRFTARTAMRGSRGAARYFVRSTRAEGAGESGLANLIDLHSIHSAGDALLTVALANTLFFSVDVHQARSRVAIYLLVTMAPFAVVAPVVGPLLDRFRNGRRYALAATLIGRAFLAWVIAGAVASKGGFELYPAAFGALICSKAYGVSRSAVVPRVLPPSVTLVRGNARLSLWGIIAAAIAAPIGQGLSWTTGSPAWTLRLATLCYLVGGVFAFRLPSRVDSNQGESRLRSRKRDDLGTSYSPVDGVGYDSDSASDAALHETRVLKLPRPTQSNLFRRILPPLRGIGSRMPTMLRAIAGLRAFSGFLTLFLAFLIRTDPLGVFSTNVDLGFIVAGATIGSALGTTLGAWLKARKPEALAIGALISAAAIGVVTAIWFNLLTATLAITITTLVTSLGKLGLDSVIQNDAADAVRTSAFARSETALQLSWVLGGFLAIVLPSNGSLGLALGSAVLAFVLAITVHGVRNSPDRGIEVLRRRRTVRAS